MATIYVDDVMLMFLKSDERKAGRNQRFCQPWYGGQDELSGNGQRQRLVIRSTHRTTMTVTTHRSKEPMGVAFAEPVQGEVLSG